MDRAKKFLEQHLPQKKNTLLVVATLLITFGVYFSFPYRGIAATFPLMFLFSFLGAKVYPNFLFCSFASFGIGIFYGMMAALPDPFTFGFVTLIVSFCGAFCGKNLISSLGKKQWGKTFLCLFFTVLGIATPLFSAGLPTQFVAERQRAAEYLEKTYPDQTFDRMTFFYDLREKGYRANVEYRNGEGVLESELFFGRDEIRDGYFTDYATALLIKRKSELVRVFQKNEMNVITQEVEILPTKDGVVPGAYGQIPEEMIALTHFSVTFREEKPERTEFAQACKEVVAALKEEKVTFGALTFYGLDAGNTVHRCQVTWDTDPESILSLVTKNS